MRASTQLGCVALIRLKKLSASSSPRPSSMKWETNGELAQRDLSELVRRLLDVESTNHGDELSRLGNKCDDQA